MTEVRELPTAADFLRRLSDLERRERDFSARSSKSIVSAATGLWSIQTARSWSIESGASVEFSQSERLEHRERVVEGGRVAPTVVAILGLTSADALTDVRVKSVHPLDDVPYRLARLALKAFES